MKNYNSHNMSIMLVYYYHRASS